MDTPVPIPNTEVKHLSADNTWLATAWESKSLPELYSSLAQSVERVTVNHDVVGSSPTGGAKIQLVKRLVGFYYIVEKPPAVLVVKRA